MKLNSLKRKLLLKIIVLCIPLGSFGQQTYVLGNQESEMTIDGTSTLHGWTSNVESLEGSVKIDFSESDISNIQDLNISILVQSIKSGKSGLDKNMYKALKAAKYPKIGFHLNSIKKESNQFNYKGALKIAGYSKEISGNVSYDQASESRIYFSGAISFNMSEFKIDPPKAMMGAIKTGDQVTIKYTLVFNKSD
jgi:polyisoprenoid-binding protein YceI